MRRLVHVFGVAALVLALGGCWAVPGQNASRTAYNAFETELTPATVGELTQAWATPTGAGSASDPVVSSAGVHVVVAGCTISTHESGTGALVWSRTHTIPLLNSCDRVVESSAPFVVGERVMWGRRHAIFSPFPRCGPNEGMTTHGSSSYHYDIATGGAPAAPAPPSLLIAGVRDLDAVSTTAKVFYGNGYDPNCPTSVRPNGVVIAGPLYDPPSTRSFETDGGSSPTRGVDAIYQAGFGTLATAPGDPSSGHALRSYSVAEARPGCGSTGIVECPLWATPIDGTAPPAILDADLDSTTAYVGTSAGTLYAIDGATGAVLWSTPVGAGVSASPALAEGVLYVPTSDGRIVAIDAAAGATLWEASTGSSIGRQPAVAGGVVYTGSDDGSVDAFDAVGCGAATCTSLWSAETGSRVTGAPAVSGGQLYVGTADGRLIAYARP